MRQVQIQVGEGEIKGEKAFTAKGVRTDTAFAETRLEASEAKLAWTRGPSGHRELFEAIPAAPLKMNSSGAQCLSDSSTRERNSSGRGSTAL
jgi:hypothetical protein